MADEKSPYMTVEEAAAYLRVSKSSIYNKLCARDLTKVKVGNRALVLREEIEGMVVIIPKRRRL